MDLAKAMQEQT